MQGNEGGIVQAHYTTDSIADRVVEAARRSRGETSPLTPETLASIDHFHGGGIASTRELAASLQPQAGERILDIGSGSGGPARWIAATFECHVTGIARKPSARHAQDIIRSICYGSRS